MVHSGNINCFGLQIYRLLLVWQVGNLYLKKKSAKMIDGDIGDFENLCEIVKDCGTFVMNDLVNINCLS